MLLIYIIPLKLKDQMDSACISTFPTLTYTVLEEGRHRHGTGGVTLKGSCTRKLVVALSMYTLLVSMMLKKINEFISLNCLKSAIYDI